MDNTFILNSSLSALERKDAINERMSKIKAIISCLLAATDSPLELSREVVNDVAWAVSDYLDEIFAIKNLAKS